MKEPVVQLVPLEGQESFVYGNYGVDEETFLKGTLHIEQPNRNPLSLLSVTITFQGSSSATAITFEETELINLTASVLPEDHDGKLAQGLHCLEWELDIPPEPKLPPSRKVQSTGMPYNRKAYRVKYRLVAALTWHGLVGKTRKEIAIPIEPFLVYPDPRRDGPLLDLIKNPPLHRWEALTALVQYDLSVSTTVLGPCDSFDFTFRVVPRGHLCENVKFKLLEVCDIGGKSAVLHTTEAANSATKRTLVAWDWKSFNFNAIEDFFDSQTHTLTLPANPRPNPTTLPFELDPDAIQPSAIIRHVIRIVIEFDDAPSIKLDCPVTILSVPLEAARQGVLSSLLHNPSGTEDKPATLKRPQSKGKITSNLTNGKSDIEGLDDNDTLTPVKRLGTETELKQSSTIKSRSTLRQIDNSLSSTPCRRVATTPNHVLYDPFSHAYAPPSITPQELHKSLSDVQNTILSKMQENNALLLDKLVTMDVEQKRLVRRVLELEGYIRETIRSSADGYESENQSTVHSHQSTSLSHFAMSVKAPMDDGASIKSASGKGRPWKLFKRRSYLDIK
ncbi:hypothetical protein DFS34DRAFT_357453 [Phlyctochytrium arcticum]|nr:hypothetical protein DFS34DRAFT_357453 [Phlyctochytrium arcticum]